MFDLKQWAAANKVSNSQLHRLSGVSECTIASVMRGCSCTERTLKVRSSEITTVLNRKGTSFSRQNVGVCVRKTTRIL